MLKILFGVTSWLQQHQRNQRVNSHPDYDNKHDNKFEQKTKTFMQLNATQQNQKRHRD